MLIGIVEILLWYFRLCRKITDGTLGIMHTNYLQPYINIIPELHLSHFEG